MKTGAGKGLVLKGGNEGSKSQAKFLAVFLFLLAIPAAIIAQNVTNVTDVIVPNVTNGIDENITIEIPEIPNGTRNGTVTTIEITVPTTTETTIEEKAELELDLEVPDRVTRGEEAKLEATVSNPSSVIAKNVILTWKLPEGFEVTSGNVEEKCGTIEPGSSCSSSLLVQPSFSSKLGGNEVSVVVSYG